jgi:hypothetical protein
MADCCGSRNSAEDTTAPMLAEVRIDLTCKLFARSDERRALVAAELLISEILHLRIRQF